MTPLLICSTLALTLGRKALLPFLHLTEQKTESWKVDHLLKVTQFLSGRAAFEPWSVELQGLCVSPHHGTSSWFRVNEGCDNISVRKCMCACMCTYMHVCHVLIFSFFSVTQVISFIPISIFCYFSSPQKLPFSGDSVIFSYYYFGGRMGWNVLGQVEQC